MKASSKLEVSGKRGKKVAGEIWDCNLGTVALKHQAQLFGDFQRYENISECLNQMGTGLIYLTLS